MAIEWRKMFEKFGAKLRDGEDAAALESRAEALLAAFPSDEDRAWNYARAGHTVADAIAAYAAELRTEGERALADMQAKLTAAEADATAAKATLADVEAQLAAIKSAPHEGNPPAPVQPPAAPQGAAQKYPNLSPALSRFAAGIKLPNNPEEN
jgi:hypothetical protein